MVEKKSANLVTYLLMIFYCLFTIITFLWVISISLKSQTDFFSSNPWSIPKLFKWSNFHDAWVIGHIGKFFINSTYVTLTATVGCLLISSLAAYVLARIKFKGRGIVQTFFLFGITLPPFMIIIPLFTILQKLHLLNSLNGLILVYITSQIPFNVYVLMGFYKNLPMEYEEAAAMDGASPLLSFFKIMMPFTWPAITACAIINILNYWNEFLFALVFLGDNKSLTLPVGLFNLVQNADYSANYSVLFAGILISSIPVLIIFAIFQRQFTGGISQGGLKM